MPGTPAPLSPEVAAEVQRLLRRQRRWFWIAAAGIILTAWAWLCSPLCKTENPTSTVPETRRSPAEIPAPVSAGTWHKVGSWQSRGDKQTEVFLIPGRDWKVVWDYRGGGSVPFFFVNATRMDKLDYIGVANVESADRDSSEIHVGGQFYLTIMTNSRPWSVTVSARY